MNIKTYVQQNTACDLTYQMVDHRLAGVNIGRFWSSIEKWHEKYPDTILRIEASKIELNTDDREEVSHFLASFGEPNSPWKKTPNDWNTQKINYTREIEAVYTHDEKVLLICTAPPPPSCIIEEVEELVPASIRKVRRIVCPKSENVVEKTEDEEALV